MPINGIILCRFGHDMKMFVYCWMLLALPLAAADSDELVERWLAAQKGIRTWSADLTQTRQLKTLKRPLRNEGRLAFSAPNRFRWELGEPPQTIAVRGTKAMRVIYPKLKRAEHYPLGGAGNEPWAHALALMDAGFPESRAQIEERFHVRSVSESDGSVTIELEPRNAMAKQFMKGVQLVFRASDFAMIANQIEFADGSILRNEFRNIVLNPELSDDVFSMDVPDDFTIVEPAKP